MPLVLRKQVAGYKTATGVHDALQYCARQQSTGYFVALDIDSHQERNSPLRQKRCLNLACVRDQTAVVARPDMFGIPDVLDFARSSEWTPGAGNETSRKNNKLYGK